MAAYVVVFLPPAATEALVVDAFASEGFLPIAGLAIGPRTRRATIDVYASGCVVKIAPSVQVQFAGSPLEKAFGERARARGASLIVIDAGFEVTELVEWDEAGRRAQDVANPDWAAGQRRYEDGDQRIARWQLEEIAESRLGARKRGASITLGFQGAAPRRVDEVLRAIEEGLEIAETTVQGKAAFRFTRGGVMRTVVLTEDEAREVRRPR